MEISNGVKRYINLLPPREQQELKILRVNGQIRDFGIWFGLSLCVAIMLFVAIRFYLKGELANSRERFGAETALLNSLETTEFRKEIELFNAELDDFKILQDSQDEWSGVLIEIAEKIPRNMTLERFSADRETGRVDIGGRAGTRDSVLVFRRALIASDRFINVNFPLSNLEKPRDLDWQYRFYLKDIK